MSLLHSVLLGFLQGITEFLPVSSSGHLAIIQNIFNMKSDIGILFDTMLHLGTLVAVCIVYWDNFSKLVIATLQLIGDCFANLRTLFSNRGQEEKEPYRRLINNAYKKFVVLILVTTIPTGIIGLLLEPLVKRADNSLLIPGICLVITAIILLISDSAVPGRKKVKRTSYRDAALVGAAQGVAVMPGISRSGATITACLMLGFDRSFAVKYSFLVSIPAIIGANILELRHLDTSLVTGSMVANCFAGMIVAGIVGYICLKALIYLVKSNKFSYFAYYCAVVGIISILFYFIKG